MTRADSLYADLILPLPLQKLYTYSIPEHMKGSLQTGSRVMIQFGKKKLYSAIIRKIHNQKPPDYPTKEIVSALDADPLISPGLLEFWDWIASYYMCTLGEVYKAALPSGLKLESETRLYENENSTHLPEDEKESMILDILRNRKTITINELSRASVDTFLFPAMTRLMNKGIIRSEETMRKSFKPKTDKYILMDAALNDDKRLSDVFGKLSRAPMQLALLMRLLDLSRKQLTAETKSLLPLRLIQNTAEFSPSSLKSLSEKGFLSIVEQTSSRLDFSEVKTSPPKTLNKLQEVAIAEIHEFFKTKTTVLLHGVTSSGKTEIYIQLIKKELVKNRQVLYLLPEIALTTHIIDRLKKVFGNKVGVYHSKFSDSERVEVWKTLLMNDENSYQVILGVRSAIFLPFRNLGLIIIDEEHENTFKQYDPAPRYHARDSAIMLADMHNAKCLLGTATPSLETYQNAKTGKFGLVELKERHGSVEMPEILITDIKEARKRRQMKSLFSPQLLEAIQQTTEQGEQVILFQNRRGFAPYLECDSCNWIPSCRQCDVSLTYHKSGNHLICHYCGFTTAVYHECKACGNPSLSTRGFGTEKIEDELQIFFPGLKVLRLDLDAARSRKAYERIFEEFGSGRASILVGTQMVSKGLNFERVGLVGILNADNMLHFPDFRAHERSFQLMAQVSGRAGRKDKKGKVIIQTNHPTHPVLHMIRENDYMGMFLSQLSERIKYNYPPVCRLIRITLKHPDQKLVAQASQQLASELTRVFGTRILGPEVPVIGRVQNKHLQTLLIKIEKELNIQKSKEIIRQSIHNLLSKENMKTLQVIADADPL